MMAVVLLSGGSFLGRILWLLSNSLFWLDDVIMTSSALLTDVALTSSESLAMVVGVALIRLGGVTFVFLMVSSNLISNFLVQLNPTPYLESELLSSYWRFRAFLLDFFNAFLRFSNFLLNYAKFWFVGFTFLPPFWLARNLDFSFPYFPYLQQSLVLCMVYAPPCFLHRLQCFSKLTFLGTLAVELVPGRFFPFSPFLEDFLEDSGLPFL